MQQKPRIVYVRGQQDYNRGLAVLKLAMELRKRPGLAMQAMLENMSQHQIVREVY